MTKSSDSHIAFYGFSGADNLKWIYLRSYHLNLLMFGMSQQAKVPNSSQYDFKGASVSLSPLRSSLLLAPTNPLLRAQATPAPHPEQEQPAVLSPTRAEASATNSLTRPINLKAPNTELPSQPKIPIIHKKISKN